MLELRSKTPGRDFELKLGALREEIPLRKVKNHLCDHRLSHSHQTHAASAEESRCGEEQPELDKEC